MSAQPEALRLADELERYHGEYPTCTESAAELCRLHADNERIRSALNGWIRENSPSGWIDDLRTQRDALLEALKLAWPIIEAEMYRQNYSYGKNFSQTRADRARAVHEKARAAIKAVEGEKT